MKRMMILAILVFVGQVLAYTPKPVQRTAAEEALTEALKNTTDDSTKAAIAKAALEANGEDARLGIAAVYGLRRGMPNAEEYLKARADGSESISKKFIYSYFYQDSTAQMEVANWILKKDPNNFWGHYLLALGEWGKAEPNHEFIKSEFEKAIAADPSQPDGYLNLGYLYEEMEKNDEALKAFEAGAVCDLKNPQIRGARLAQYAGQRMADQYFALLPQSLPKEAVSLTLKSANGKTDLSPETLKGKMSLLEFWGYS